MKSYIFTFAITAIFVSFGYAQVPLNVAIQIQKAEDARRYDKTLEDLMKSPNADVRKRAALGAGRIGNERALPSLANLLANDRNTDVRAMAAFAIGEIESANCADIILEAFKTNAGTELPNENNAGMKPPSVVARLVEAAGKIAAANPKDPKAAELGKRIIETLIYENTKRSAPDEQVIRLGLTAVLRARPAEADEPVIAFLGHVNPAIVADALNTLARLRVKSLNAEARILLTHTDLIVRANAARVLGAAEDKDAIDLLIKAATADTDSRVRVAAIRALGSVKDAKAADKLIARGNQLITAFTKTKTGRPAETSELLEIASALGRLLPNTDHIEATSFLNEFLFDDRLVSPEAMIAIAAIYPSSIAKYVAPTELGYANPKYPSAYAQGIRVIADSKNEELRLQAAENLRKYIAGLATKVKRADQGKFMTALPELMRSLAAFKPDNLDEILRGHLANDDPFLRSTAAELIAERPSSKQNIDALKASFAKSMILDKRDNDAQLAIIDALYKLDKRESVGALLMSLNAADYLVRKKAFELLTDKDLQKDFPGIAISLEAARKNKNDQVLPYSVIAGTRLGQVLNTDADYRRALSRKNGSVKAVLTTEKGAFTIDLFPEDAPLTVDNFIKLANAKYFDGLEVHRVVPNFVMQDGDPRGDGNGGPGWSIRCEVNMLIYERGAVGMALSGKDTGGSQWFVTHSPQPHLDGGYTIFGHVNETGMKVVDKIVRGDKILSVKIIGR